VGHDLVERDEPMSPTHGTAPVRGGGPSSSLRARMTAGELGVAGPSWSVTIASRRSTAAPA
jgi:hypothetical protein